MTGPKTETVFGIDLGGTKLRTALADRSGVILAERVEPTDSRGGLDVIAQIDAALTHLSDDAGIGRQSVRLTVMGCPGVLQSHSGKVAAAPNIPGFDRLDVVHALEACLRMPVTVENDVNLAAEGEIRQGRRSGDFVFVAHGTGIGMGIVANGSVVRGARGAAGEIAYLPLGGDPFDPEGFRFGTLETVIGSAAILKRYAAHGGSAGKTVRDIFDALNRDDAADLALDETACILAQAIAAVAAVLDPEVVVTGGSIGARSELIQRVRLHLKRCMPAPPPVEISGLGDRAAVVGALGVALRRLGETA